MGPLNGMVFDAVKWTVSITPVTFLTVSNKYQPLDTIGGYPLNAGVKCSSTIARIPTYIEGFDEALEGGIPSGYIVLIAGSPGTMKSTVACNILYNNVVKRGAKCIYMTLEQSRQSLETQSLRFGIDLGAVRESMHVLDFAVVRRNLKHLTAEKSWMEVFKMYIGNLKESFPFDFVVIDSLDVLEMASEIKNKRDELFYLFEWLRELNSTILLTCETPAGKLIELGNDVSYLADGIISLYIQDVSDVEAQRRIRCLKLRSTNHSMDSFTFITEGNRFMAVKAISK